MTVADAAEVADLLARCTFPPRGTPVWCAVSGGPDSTALLALAVAAGLEVTAVHVDHRLRPGSEGEAALVQASAERLGAGFEARSAPMPPGPNLEERARRARYAVLPPGALLGHTADDQAETVLLALLRGTGLHGLAGMRTDDGRRPLLGLRRHETVALCAALDLDVVDDPSNDDRALRRNRVRHDLLPLLDDIAERDMVPLLCRLAGIARDAADHLDVEAATLEVTDAATLAAADPVLARLAVRSWLRDADPSGQLHPPDAAAIERVLAVAAGRAVATDIAGGGRVARSGGRLRLERPT